MLFIPPALNQEYCHIQNSSIIFSVHVNELTHTGRRDRSQSHHVASFKKNINLPSDPRSVTCNFTAFLYICVEDLPGASVS